MYVLSLFVFFCGFFFPHLQLGERSRAIILMVFLFNLLFLLCSSGLVLQILCNGILFFIFLHTSKGNGLYFKSESMSKQHINTANFFLFFLIIGIYWKV